MRVAVVLLCWTVSAIPLRATDGDTLVVVARVWPSVVKGTAVMVPEKVRVLGVNTPERRGVTREAGDKAKAFTEQWINGSDLRLLVCGEERDSFGRLLATVTRARDGANLTDDLIRSGHATPYGKK